MLLTSPKGSGKNNLINFMKKMPLNEKAFEQILKMDQETLKMYLESFLKKAGYEVVNEDGFLYAKGTDAVLLAAHMDRHPVHKTLVKKITKEKNINGHAKWSSPQGICGDDRCGVWIIMNVIQEHHPSVIFCEDEEIGCIGSMKFSESQYVKNLGVNYIVQIDRHGSHDAVFYENDNREFIAWIEEKTGYKEAHGTWTDIGNLMPASGIAGVNLSSGYYLEHSYDEYIIMEEMYQTMKVVGKLVAEESPKWEFIKKVHMDTWYNFTWNRQYSTDSLHSYTLEEKKIRQKIKKAVSDVSILMSRTDVSYNEECVDDVIESIKQVLLDYGYPVYYPKDHRGRYFQDYI